MKSIFTFITALVLSLTTMASRNEVRLSITSLTQSPVRVIINGQLVNSNDNSIRIGNLNPGIHRIQVYSRNRYGNGWGNRNQQGQLLYNGTINLRRGIEIDMVINRFGRVYIDEQPYDYRRDDDWDNGGWNNGDGWNNGNGNRGNGWLQPMDNNTFQQLKRTVQNESFDDNKLSMLKSVLPNNGISSAQVRELMLLMSFEQNKLEFAKYAYRYTSDKNNYFTVNDVLNFSNSRNELNRYITDYRD